MALEKDLVSERMLYSDVALPPQEIMGPATLSATEVYISITGRHLNEAIALLDD
jgi:hypothetical protein